MGMSRILRYFIYGLELLVLFVLQQTPGLFPEIYGTRPVLLIPAAITIALFEREIPAMAYGVAAGLLLDFGFGGALGIHALLLALICFFVSLLTKTVLQMHFVTALITAVWTVALMVFAGWLLQYVLPGYTHPGYALLHCYLPKYLYTLLLFPLIFLINRGVSGLLKAQEQ